MIKLGRKPMHPIIPTISPVITLLSCCFGSFIFCILGIRVLLHYMRKHRKFQPIRAEGPESHQKKVGTPTMAGLAVSLVILLDMILFCDLGSPQIQVAIYFVIVFSAIGLADDVLKVFWDNPKGFQGSKKLVLQLLLTAGGILYLFYRNPEYLSSDLLLPFGLRFPLYALAPVFYVLIICGSSNAANMTDGLDGLLAVPVMAIGVTMLATLVTPWGQHYFSAMLDRRLLFDLIIILTAIVASFGGFLVYNIHPAKVFLGDVGSLMIGSLLCYIAILLGIELAYGLMATLFIVEILSTVLQIGCFKITGRRLFKMAPFHHHLEKSGMAEKKVVTMLWFFNLGCCFFAFLMLYCSVIC